MILLMVLRYYLLLQTKILFSIIVANIIGIKDSYSPSFILDQYTMIKICAMQSNQ